MRIAIVNDLLMATEALRRVVSSRPDHTIAWTAKDGAEAVAKCARDRPDLILMDMIMPVMNGVESTRLIMRDTPCAILVVTATVDGNIGLVFDAMGHGALDAVNTPVLGAGGQVTGREELLRKIEIIGKLTGRPGRFASFPGTAPEGLPPGSGHPPMVAIGCSTGGPAALATILAGVPERWRAAVVVAQHVDEMFAAELATWLGRRTSRRVEVAVRGSRPVAGDIWLAGTNDHVVLTAGCTLDYTREPLDCFFRPSVDVFFKSMALNWPSRGVGILLTGMGRDGATGLLALRQAGWHTIAQDEQSSIVYGMPRAAAELGAAVEVLPLDDIAAAVVSAVEKL
ncbi:MAG: chemotaxis response regulator protein-glutamate methylesterase [Candidatus Riflebacteria bacterium]|nr:chemotaxis response regulator protein-glutamate methylesterase [Candidatus Riflebacteria bacterium]